MLERVAFGELPRKHHTALRSASGDLRYEECLTRRGFEGPYTIAYHLRPPQALRATVTSHLRRPLVAAEPGSPLARRHYWTSRVESRGAPLEARVPLLYNTDVVLAVARPTESDSVYSVNADGDELLFVRRGRGTVRSALGDLPFGTNDYVYLPKGVLYRIEIEAGTEQEFLSIECEGGVSLPAHLVNEAGQLRMDAPYCHRDFVKPQFRGPLDEGIREIVVKRAHANHGYVAAASPLDVVGWDGTVYPFAFPILAFQPRVGAVHLPPTWHGTFAARGALICSFVPRPLDFHPDAVPCPYPHSSVDVDEVLYYASGDFTSRSGVGEGSLTLHPRGVPHGPQPGRYEGSVGKTTTDELAVMLDCAEPLRPTRAAEAVRDESYDASFAAGGGHAISGE